MSQQLFSASDAAKFLGVHRVTVSAWAKSGKLKTAHEQTNLMLFERDELERRRAEIQQNPVRAGRPKKETK